MAHTFQDPFAPAATVRQRKTSRERGKIRRRAAAAAAQGAPDGSLSAAEAAERLGVAPSEIRRRCREGELPCSKNSAGAWTVPATALS